MNHPMKMARLTRLDCCIDDCFCEAWGSGRALRL
jgi:hypothetical protein